MLRQPGPRRLMTSFQSGRKERTQRSPIRGPSAPPRTRGVISVSLEDSHQDPRLRPASPPRSRVANLPSSRANHLRLARSHPSTKKDKRPFRSPAHRTEALNANHSSVAPGTDSVRPPFPTLAVTGVPSANSGHCSAIPDAVAALWEPAARDEMCSTQLPLLFCQLRLSGLHHTTPHLWPRTRPLLGKGSGVATCPSRRDAQH